MRLAQIYRCYIPIATQYVVWMPACDLVVKFALDMDCIPTYIEPGLSPIVAIFQPTTPYIVVNVNG